MVQGLGVRVKDSTKKDVGKRVLITRKGCKEEEGFENHKRDKGDIFGIYIQVIGDSISTSTGKIRILVTSMPTIKNHMKTL